MAFFYVRAAFPMDAINFLKPRNFKMNRTRRMNQLTIAFLMAATLPLAAYPANDLGKARKKQSWDRMRWLMASLPPHGLKNRFPVREAFQ